MQRVTRRFLANLPTAGWLPRVEWSADNGATWTEVAMHAGTVEADAGQQARWSCNLTVSGVEVSRAGFSLFATRLRVSLGLVFGEGDVEWCGLGVYVLDGDVTRHRDGTLDVTGKSLEQVVMDDRFTSPRTFRPQPGQTLTAQLLGESIPGVSLLWLVEGDPTLPKLIEERDRWGLIDGRTDDASIARSLGARCYTDGRGAFVMAPVPSLADEPVWSVTDGADGVRVELAETLSASGVHNMVVVRGVADDGKPAVGPVVLGDTEPTSPTWIGLRRKPLFYSSPLLKNVAQCNHTAQSLLAPNLGYAAQVNLTAVLNPALEVGDVVAVTMDDGTVQRHICDRVTYDLAAATMSITGRQAATSLLGQPVDLDALYGQDQDDTGVGDVDSPDDDEDAA